MITQSKLQDKIHLLCKRIAELEVENKRLEGDVVLAKAEARGTGTVMLEVQQECIESNKQLVLMRPVVDTAVACDDGDVPDEEGPERNRALAVRAYLAEQQGAGVQTLEQTTNLLGAKSSNVGLPGAFSAYVRRARDGG